MSVNHHLISSALAATWVLCAPAWADIRTNASPPVNPATLEPVPIQQAAGQVPLAAFVPRSGASVVDVEPGSDLSPSTFSLGHDEGLYVARRGETLLARGATYKAAADDSSFTYIPFLGSQASRNWPIRFQLEKVSVDGEPLVLDRDAAELDGKTMILPRGPVDARYRLTESSVEQTFTLDASAVRGNVEFRVTIETDLHYAQEAGGLRFSGPDGGVQFGSATVLDQGGRSMSVPLQLEGSTLVYRVPEVFTREATGSLVLDPLITTLTLDDFQAELTSPDVAYDADENVYCVVYEEVFSGADRDLYYRIFDGSTFAVLDGQYLDNSSLDTHSPALATIAASGRFVVVYTTIDTFGRPIIHTRSRLANAASGFGAEFVLAGFDEFFTRENPDVGGEAYESATGTSNAAVVFEERPRGGSTTLGIGIRARLIDRDGVPAASYITIAPALTSLDYTKPAISKFSGDPLDHGAWWVATLAGNVGSQAKEIRTTRMAFNGTLELANQVIHTELGSAHLRSVDVTAPYTGNYDETVTISMERAGVAEGHVAVKTTARNGLPMASTGRFQLMEEVDASPTILRTTPAVATLAGRALITYYERNFAAGNYRILSSSMELPNEVGLGVGERRIPLGALEQAGPFTSTRAASALSGGVNGTSQNILTVWQDQPASSSSSNIYGALVTLATPPVLASTFCGGGVNSTGDRAYLAMFGGDDIVTPKTCRATQLPQSSLGYFLVGQGPSSIVPPNSQGVLCIGGAIGRYRGDVLNSGATGRFFFDVDPTDIPTPTGSVAVLAGQRFYFQAWFRDANPTPTSNFTNAVIVQF